MMAAAGPGIDPDMSVLLVEPSRPLADLLTACLRQAGLVEIDAARSPAAALRRLARRSYDLIVSGERLPAADHELLEAEDATGRRVRPSLLLVTPSEGFDGPGSAQADAVLTMPFTLDMLLEALAEARPRPA